MSDIKIDLDALADKIIERGGMRQQDTLSMGTKLGIALGGISASTCYMARQVPVLGHGVNFIGDVAAGTKMGYAVKTEQLRQQEAQKLAEQQAAANRVVAPAPA